MLVFQKFKNDKIDNKFIIDEKTKFLLLKSKNCLLFKDINNINFFYFSKNVFFIRKNALICLLKNAEKLLKSINQFFFFEYKIIGLGYKIHKVRKFFRDKIICLKLGFAHKMLYKLPSNIHLVTGKRRLFIYSKDWESLNAMCKHLFFLKKLNSYKIKGLVPVKKILKLKVKQKKIK